MKEEIIFLICKFILKNGGRLLVSIFDINILEVTTPSWQVKRQKNWKINNFPWISKRGEDKPLPLRLGDRWIQEVTAYWSSNTSENQCRNKCWANKAWTVNELLTGSICMALWVKNLGVLRHRGLPNIVRVMSRSQIRGENHMGEKHPCAPSNGRREGNHFEIYQSTLVFLTNPALRGNEN